MKEKQIIEIDPNDNTSITCDVTPTDVYAEFLNKSDSIAVNLMQKETDKDVIVGITYVLDYTCFYYWSVTKSRFTKLTYNDNNDQGVTITFK